MSKDTMREFEEFLDSRKCLHGVDVSDVCPTCEREMMEDFVVHNLDILSPAEVAQAIREGVTKLETIEQIVNKL